MFENRRKPNIDVKGHLTSSDLLEHPVLIIGQKKHLFEVHYETIKCKFGSKDLREVIYKNILDIVHFTHLKYIYRNGKEL